MTDFARPGIGSQRRRVRGYTDIGPVRVPPRPQFIVLTDLGTGAEWALIHDADNVLVGITDELPGRHTDVVRYPPGEGPRLAGAPSIQLIIRDGHLGYKHAALAQGVQSYSSARSLTRRQQETRAREIKVPDGWRPGDVLSHVDLEF